MFSWSSTSRKGGTGGRSGYPAANRTPAVAQTIQGTIRPPEFSRQQHLDSYRNDTTLQRSTRKVSQGELCFILCIQLFSYLFDERDGGHVAISIVTNSDMQANSFTFSIFDGRWNCFYFKCR